VLELDSIFSEEGALAQAVSGFRPRPFQLDMSRAVASAIEDRNVLVAEAGTGTGKTFAYLVPALRSGGKVIISTGTKTLQDQLFDRDIPIVRSALKLPVSVAVLKGRANYVCHHHLERALGDGRFASREDARDLAVIARFAKTSVSGDRADCSGVSETAPVWSHVTSTRENCLGAECRHFDSCYVMQARKQALEADVVVVNHHLFFAEVVLRDEGVGELLPSCNTVIFDEAHQIPETATLFFGESTTTAQLVALARDTIIERRSVQRTAGRCRTPRVRWKRRHATCGSSSLKRRAVYRCARSSAIAAFTTPWVTCSRRSMRWRRSCSSMPSAPRCCNAAMSARSVWPSRPNAGAAASITRA
jgi:ATP-dependent DNA helicase DinG